MKRTAALLLLPALLACSPSSSGSAQSALSSASPSGSAQFSTEETEMDMFIDDESVKVNWLSNASVEALKAICPLTVSMSRYGGFEQVGPLGKTLPSDDVRIETEPGDIMLYDSSNIVVFFGTNRWEYTKLGRIDLPQAELERLLNKPAITLRIE